MRQARRQPKSAAFLSRTFPSADRRNATETRRIRPIQAKKPRNWMNI